MRTGVPLLLLLAVLLPAPVFAAEPPALIRARSLYNAADYDGAIAAAATVVASPTQPGAAEAAALVSARAHLERYRRGKDPADLDAARDAFNRLQVPALVARDQIDLLVGLGQSLYLRDLFGSAAELFDTALGRAATVSARDRWLLLDWWATAVDRDAQTRPVERRAAAFENMAARMRDELQADPGNAPANYWLAVAARGAGEAERAWDLAIAGWIRARLVPATAATLRGDLDRLVTEALIPERVNTRPPEDRMAAAAALGAQWAQVKETWR